MEYRAGIVIVNDDPDPATDSVAHIIQYRLRDEGLVSVIVTAEVSTRERLEHPDHHPDDPGTENDRPDEHGRQGGAQAGTSPDHAAA